MKLFSHKKGLELPLTTIVVVIIALIFLGLMLPFIRNTFNQLTGIIDPAIKEIKEATEIAFQTRGEVLYLRGGNDIPVKRGNLESIRMGIYNTASKEVCYRVAVRCLNAFTIGNSCVGDQNAVLVGGTDAEGNRPVQNWFTQLNAEQSILGSDAYSSPVTLKLPTQLKPDTYVIEILAYKELNEAACPGIDWAPEPYVTKRFNLVVT